MIVTNYIPQEYIDKMTELKIPVVAVSFQRSDAADKGKLNPTFKDDEVAYTEGFYDGIELLGKVANREKEAAELISFVKTSQEQLRAKFSDFIVDKRPKIYMANPDLTIYGSGKYTGIMFMRAGAQNVAAESIKGYKQVSAEQVLAWAPQMIFVQDRYPQVPAELKSNPQLANLSAVKEDKIYMMPEYAKAWSYPTAEAMALGEWWLAMKLYPKHFDEAEFKKKWRNFIKNSTVRVINEIFRPAAALGPAICGIAGHRAVSD